MADIEVLEQSSLLGIVDGTERIPAIRPGGSAGALDMRQIALHHGIVAWSPGLQVSAGQLVLYGDIIYRARVSDTGTQESPDGNDSFAVVTPSVEVPPPPVLTSLGSRWATSDTLPTVPPAANLTIPVTWTIEADAPAGVSAAKHSLNLPDLPPDDATGGIWVTAKVDGSAVSRRLLPWGARGLRSANLVVKTSSDPAALPIKFAAGGLVLVIYYLRASDGAELLQLTSNADTLPAASTVEIHAAGVFG